jgi:hypothetical protein
MFKRLTLLVLIALIALLPLGSAFADDPAIGSKEDNACNPGGEMNGKCTTEWDWVCGWYLARVKSGLIPRVISACSILQPVAPADTSAPELVFICISTPGQHDVLYYGVVNQFGNADVFISMDGTCSGGFNPGLIRTIIQAPDMAAANTIHVSLGGAATCTQMNAQYPVPADWWRCN